MYSSLYFYSGLPLGKLVYLSWTYSTRTRQRCFLIYPLHTCPGALLEDCTKMAAGLSDYGQTSMLLMLLPFQQCASNLMGRSSDILNLNQGSLQRLRKQHGWKLGTGGSGEFTEASLRLQIALYCEEFELAANLMMQVKANTPSSTVSLWMYQQRVFLYCLLEIRALKGSRSRAICRQSHHREASKLYNQIRKWVVEKGSINSAHKLLILDAEMLSLQAGRKNVDRERLEQAYDRAIAASTKGTNPQ